MSGYLHGNFPTPKHWDLTLKQHTCRYQTFTNEDKNQDVG